MPYHDLHTFYIWTVEIVKIKNNELISLLKLELLKLLLRVVYITFNIYVFITISGSIPLLVDY